MLNKATTNEITTPTARETNWSAENELPLFARSRTVAASTMWAVDEIGKNSVIPSLTHEHELQRDVAVDLIITGEHPDIAELYRPCPAPIVNIDRPGVAVKLERRPV